MRKPEVHTHCSCGIITSFPVALRVHVRFVGKSITLFLAVVLFTGVQFLLRLPPASGIPDLRFGSCGHGPRGGVHERTLSLALVSYARTTYLPLER